MLTSVAIALATECTVCENGLEISEKNKKQRFGIKKTVLTFVRLDDCCDCPTVIIIKTTATRIIFDECNIVLRMGTIVVRSKFRRLYNITDRLWTPF